MERNCLFSELKIQQEKVEKFQSHLQSIYQLLKFSCETKLIFENKKRYILNKVLTLEKYRDANRDRKLSSLILRKNCNFDTNYAEVINLTPYGMDHTARSGKFL